MQDFTEIKDKFPFLSCVAYRESEFICIIQNHDDKIMTFYDYNTVSFDHRPEFIEAGDCWWWESNRMLPINIFLPERMKQFRYAIRTVAIKDVEVVFGPVTSLNNLLKKRIKRRQIQLVRKPS